MNNITGDENYDDKQHVSTFKTMMISMNNTVYQHQNPFIIIMIISMYQTS